MKECRTTDNTIHDDAKSHLSIAVHAVICS